MTEMELRIEKIQHRDGVNLDLFGCVKQPKGGVRCTQLDRISFDMDDRKAGKHEKVQDVIAKTYSGKYEEQTCDRLGYKYVDGECVDKPAPKKSASKPAPKEESKKTTMVIPKKKR